jgi:hypothetical protein
VSLLEQNALAVAAVALDAVAVDVPAERAAAAPPPYARRGACGRLLLYNPLARLLGWALALALVLAVTALNIVWAAVTNAAGYARKAALCPLMNLLWRRVLGELLVFPPLKALFFLPRMTKYALFAQWHAILDFDLLPWLRPLLFALPVWRSPTAKLRAFAGAGDAGATQRLLGAGRGSGEAAAAAAKRRLGQQLRRGVDASQGGALGNNTGLAVVVRMLAAGAPVDAVDAIGESALHEMCYMGNVRAAKALLAGGADPDLRAASGKTPLHAAAVENNPAAVKLLLKHGADPSLLNNNGKTPLMVVGTGLMVGGAAETTRAPLLPTPTWHALAKALAPAANGAAAARAVLALLPAEHGLRRLQLFDLLWDRNLQHDAAVARRRLIFYQLIAPLLREAPARKLETNEKALLIRACQATAGHRKGDAPAAREGHRDQFDAEVRWVMALFAAELGDEYTALAAQPSGDELLALPATALLNGTTKSDLSQDAAAVGRAAPWLDDGADGDLAGAFRCALAPSGAVCSPEELCELLQSGRHRLLPESRIEHFDRDVSPMLFWLHLCVLQSVARHEPLNAEFHAHIKKKLDGVAGAHFKDAALKGVDRTMVKAAQYHEEMGLPDTPAGAGAAAARVIDIVRCSFEVPSAQAALALCAWLDAASLAEHGVRALRRKNGFHADAPSAGGYRDIKYNLLFQSPTVPGAFGRAIVEVQIIVEAYLNVKKKMHAVYRIDRGDFG